MQDRPTCPERKNLETDRFNLVRESQASVSNTVNYVQSLPLFARLSSKAADDSSGVSPAFIFLGSRTLGRGVTACLVAARCTIVFGAAVCAVLVTPLWIAVAFVRDRLNYAALGLLEARLDDWVESNTHLQRMLDHAQLRAYLAVVIQLVASKRVSHDVLGLFTEIADRPNPPGHAEILVLLERTGLLSYLTEFERRGLETRLNILGRHGFNLRKEAASCVLGVTAQALPASDLERQATARLLVARLRQGPQAFEGRVSNFEKPKSGRWFPKVVARQASRLSPGLNAPAFDTRLGLALDEQLVKIFASAQTEFKRVVELAEADLTNFLPRD